MSREQSITFANVIVRFGPRLVLLNLVEEVVIPAFIDPSLRRKYGETAYLFLDTGWATYKSRDARHTEFCLFGRLVKDTVLHSEQVLRDGHLVPSDESIASAPSSFFVLILSNHKLVYLPETPSAPSLETFGSTLENFLKRKHADYITAETKRRRGSPEAITKSALLEEIPAPKVEVMPLASRESIEQFVNSIEKLTHLEFRILDTNREFQMRGPYQQIREDKQRLRAKTGKLVYDNSQGMSKEEAANEIATSAASGNQAVVVGGTAADGTKMSGNNDKLKMRVPVDNLPDDSRRKALRLAEIFQDHAVAGNIALDEPEGGQDKVEEVARKFLGAGDGNQRP